MTVKVGQDKHGDNGLDARIVCVRNRNNRKDWIAIICTDMSLSENDINLVLFQLRNVYASSTVPHIYLTRYVKRLALPMTSNVLLEI